MLDDIEVLDDQWQPAEDSMHASGRLARRAPLSMIVVPNQPKMRDSTTGEEQKC
jgi:hypothetical protein